MSTHNDYVLDNDTGANFRTDLNNYIDALVTSNSSATEPSNPVAGMWWVDTSGSPVYLKLRDSTNTLWTNIYDLTNDEGIIASVATDASSINNISPSSVANTPNTIYVTGTNTEIANDIVGNISGYAGTLNTKSLATILDISGRKQKTLPWDAGEYNDIANLMFIWKSEATTGYEDMAVIKAQASGDVIIKYAAQTHSGSTGNVKVTINTTDIPFGPYDLTTMYGDGTVWKYYETTITAGDLIKLKADVTTSTGYSTFYFGLSYSDRGIYSEESP